MKRSADDWKEWKEARVRHASYSQAELGSSMMWGEA